MKISEDVKHILDRLKIDQTDDRAELVIVYRSNGGPFRRILLDELPRDTLSKHRYLTGATLRAICEAALAHLSR